MADLLFGLNVTDQNKKSQAVQNQPSFAPPDTDGATIIPTNGYGADTLSSSYVLSLDAGVASEAELIEKYRTMAIYSKVKKAVDEIINDAIVYEGNKSVVSLGLDDIDEDVIPRETKKIMRDEFAYVLKLMSFTRRGQELFERWYVDSKLTYHKVIDKRAPDAGIQELRMLDPRKTKRVKEVETVKDPETGVNLQRVKDEYYLYLEQAGTYNKTFSSNLFGDATYKSGQAPRGVGIYKISKDAIASVNSGLLDPTSGVVYGYLHGAIKPFNQVRMLEDAVVIYRLSRAAERRIFYVDTGSLPPNKAEFFVKQLQNKYRNKISYDARTGDVTDQRRTLAMQEDFWLPRREGSRGTEIETLPGAQNLGEITDVVYFKDELWESLNVPTSRFKDNGGGNVMFDGGFASISREELKFSKFVKRLQLQFSLLFHDVLRTQLILTNVLTEDEWNAIEDKIKYVFAADSSFTEAKSSELLGKRLQLLAEVDPYVGKYYSRLWVQREVLKMDDDAIAAEEKQMISELQLGVGGVSQGQEGEFPTIPSSPVAGAGVTPETGPPQLAPGEEEQFKTNESDCDPLHRSAEFGFHVVTRHQGVHVGGPHKTYGEAAKNLGRHHRDESVHPQHKHAIVVFHHGDGEYSHVTENGQLQVARWKMR